jgi:hypothetical protein
MDWVAINVGDYPPKEWDSIVQRAKAAGLEVVPWRRCWDTIGLASLLEIAAARGWYAIANLEKELEGALPAEVAGPMIARYPELEVAISTEGWLYENVSWRAFAGCPVLLQLFPADMHRDPDELPDIQVDCVRRARDFGFRNVGVTYQTYHGADPAWYAFWPGVRSYYTGDDIGGSWDAWAVTT